MLQGYMLLISLIFWVSKIPITSFTSSTTLFKRDLSISSHSHAFPFLSLPVHPESFAINYIKFNFTPLPHPPNPHFSFFFSTKISDWPPQICSSTCSALSFSHVSSLLCRSIWCNVNTFHHHHVSLCQ